MTASNATRAVRIGSARSLGAKLLAASLATLAMAGCKTTDDPTRVAGWTLIDSAQRHPILVSQEPTTHLIRMGRGSNGLSSPQRAQLLDFIAHFRATDAGNSRLIVAVPSGGANEVSAMYAVGEIRSMLNDQGFGKRRSPSRPITPRAPAIRRSASPTCATSLSHRSAATGRRTSPTTR